MKTKFIKKLSFVLVVAMVLSLFVPAAGAFAASSVKLNSTKKYLHLDVDDLNEYNFNILSEKGKGWKYFWESSNENVAEVIESNGVTVATGVGTATITLTITDKDGEDVDTATAKVIVRDNIETVEITNKPEGDKLAVGVENDFNRSYTTVSGSSKKTSSITRWTVDSEDASIDDKGNFVATKAGEYKVTARSFQSKARYNAWVDDAVKYADYVLATDETTVVVAGKMLEAKQTGLSSVDVYFDSPVADADKNLSVHQIVGTTAVKQLVKEVKLSEDKKVASVTMYVPFTAAANYRVDYTGMDSEPFTAATTKWEDVVALNITTSQATINKATEIKFELLNADGTVINTTELEGRVDMTSKAEVGTFFNATDKEVTIFNKDTFATITATFHTYKYDTEGNELGAISVTAIVYGVEEAATDITGLNSWTIVKGDGSGNFDPKFDDTKKQLAVGDAGYRLFVEFLTSDTNTKINSKDDFAKFDYTSSDKNKLIIDQLGNVYPVANGDVVVVVLYGEAGSRTPIGAVPVTISAERSVATFTLDKYSVVLSNSTDLARTAEVKIELKDQLGGDFDYKTIDVAKLAGPTQVGAVAEPTGVGVGLVKPKDGKIVFSGDGRAAGEYQFKVTVKDKVAVITVTIQDGAGTVSYNKLKLSSSSIDVKADKDNKGKIDLTIEVIGYNSKGVETKSQPVTGAALGSFKVEVEAPSGYKLAGFNAGTNKYELSTATSGSSVTKAATGNYKVTAYEMKTVNSVLTWVPIEVLYFSVTDSQVKPVLAEVKTRIFEQDLTDVTFGDDVKTDVFKDIVKASLKFTLDGTEIDTVQSVDVFGTETEFNIKAVTIRQTIEGGAHIDHKVNVGLTVAK